jgi:hypothetical protein
MQLKAAVEVSKPPSRCSEAAVEASTPPSKV